MVAAPKPAEPPPPILQQQQHQLQTQIKTEPTDSTRSVQSHEESEKNDSAGSCVIGGPPPPVESLLAHISSQLETGGGMKAEIDSEFLMCLLEFGAGWWSWCRWLREKMTGTFTNWSHFSWFSAWGWTSFWHDFFSMIMLSMLMLSMMMLWWYDDDQRRRNLTSFHSVSVAAADQQTKEWLYSNKVSLNDPFKDIFCHQSLVHCWSRWPGWSSTDGDERRHRPTGSCTRRCQQVKRERDGWMQGSSNWARTVLTLPSFTENVKDVDVPCAWTLAGDFNSLHQLN